MTSLARLLCPFCGSLSLWAKKLNKKMHTRNVLGFCAHVWHTIYLYICVNIYIHICKCMHMCVNHTIIMYAKKILEITTGYCWLHRRINIYSFPMEEHAICLNLFFKFIWKVNSCKISQLIRAKSNIIFSNDNFVLRN